MSISKCGGGQGGSELVGVSASSSLPLHSLHCYCVRHC